LWFLLDDGDILVGFLWVIDLGVGLIFFIFILHYTTFLHQKATLNKAAREVLFLSLAGLFFLMFFYFFGHPVDPNALATHDRTWVFLVH
jgi:hypothetical protein